MENQEQNDYFWTVECMDGTTLSDGFGNKIEEVFDLNKKGKIKYFILFMPNNEHSKLVVKLGGKRRLIYFKRRMNHLYSGGKFTWTVTALGWQEKVGKTNIKAISYIYPNGGIEFNNDEPTLAQAYHEALIKLLDEKVDTKL
jgi:hypothetical protein